MGKIHLLKQLLVMDAIHPILLVYANHSDSFYGPQKTEPRSIGRAKEYPIERYCSHKPITDLTSNSIPGAASATESANIYAGVVTNKLASSI